MARPKVTKLEVAKRHLEAAITMLFDEYDVVPVHTILFAASEVLGDLCDNAGVESEFDKAVAERIKPEFQKEWYQLTRKHALFFKHAEKDPTGELELFRIDSNDYLALSTLMRYRTLNADLSPEMRVFLSWFGWVHPTCLTAQPNAASARISELFDGLTRPERLLFGRLMIAAQRGGLDEAGDVLMLFKRRFPRSYDAVAAALEQAAMLSAEGR